jgi:hypothetical protein
MAAHRRAGSFSPKTSLRLRVSKVDMLYDMACPPEISFSYLMIVVVDYEVSLPLLTVLFLWHILQILDVVNSVEIRCTKDGPNLIVVDGNVFAAKCVDAVLQQTSHNVTERIEKLSSGLKKRRLKSSKETSPNGY